MTKQVFEYDDYKKYLSQTLATTGEQRGIRSKLAQTLSCQTAFVSQVLNGHTHFSPEHAFTVSDFLGHSPLEKKYFLLLVNKGRSGSKALEEFYEKQLEEIRKERDSISESVKAAEWLDENSKAVYYQSWHYAAIHSLISIPEFQQKEKIAQKLKLPLPMVSEILEFLVSVKLAKFEKGNYKVSSTRIHVPKGSPLLSKHLINWRMKSVQSMDNKNAEDVFYSAVWSLSEKDFKEIRALLLEKLVSLEPVLSASKEETLCCLNLDLFKI